MEARVGMAVAAAPPPSLWLSGLARAGPPGPGGAERAAQLTRSYRGMLQGRGGDRMRALGQVSRGDPCRTAGVRSNAVERERSAEPC